MTSRVETREAMKITNDLVRSRFEKLELLAGMGVAPFAYSAAVTHRSAEILAHSETLVQSGETVRLAGRFMAKRGHGKASFGELLDAAGRIQLYFREDALGETNYALLRLLDLGDWIAVAGQVFLTRTGEVTVAVRELTLLAKALFPPPSQWHGLKDVETRYRQRYADLIVNDEVRRVFRLRTAVVSAIRRFLDARGFVEVETPILQPIYGGAFARPFTTQHHALGLDLYLRISDELYLKRLIVGGLDRVYEIGKDFRNEGMDRTHSPEFTMLEYYQAYADYLEVLETAEEMIAAVRTEIGQSGPGAYDGQEIDWSRPFRRVTFFGALAEATGQDLDVAAASVDQLVALAGARELPVPPRPTREVLYELLFDHLVQPRLVNPTFVLDYPQELSPLAKAKRGDSRLVERFELVVCGIEIANAFSEQNDPLAQEEALRAQEARREAGAAEAQALDLDYIRALLYGMPPTGGFGMGIDRLVMLLSGAKSIRDVVLFPPLRPDAADVALDAEVAQS
jgi:lysyl-tRNA synthetase class 2